jgi:hypothetical protein
MHVPRCFVFRPLTLDAHTPAMILSCQAGIENQAPSSENRSLGLLILGSHNQRNCEHKRQHGHRRECGAYGGGSACVCVHANFLVNLSLAVDTQIVHRLVAGDGPI